MAMRFSRLATLVLGTALFGCRGKPASVDTAPPAPEPAPPSAAPRKTAALDLLDRLSRCEVDHQGVLVDFGGPAVQGITGAWSLSSDNGLVDAERDGETWARAMNRNLAVRFVLDQAEPLFVSLRARGGLSRSVAVAIDGRPLGVMPLIRGQARVVSTRATGLQWPRARTRSTYDSREQRGDRPTRWRKWTGCGSERRKTTAGSLLLRP